jgi:hypothetical protein
MFDGMRRKHYIKQFGDELGDAIVNFIDEAQKQPGGSAFASNVVGWLSLVDPSSRTEALRWAEFRLMLQSMKPEVIRAITHKNRLELMVQDCQRAIKGPDVQAHDQAKLVIDQLTRQWREAEAVADALKETIRSKEKGFALPWKWYVDRYGDPETVRRAQEPSQD